MACVWLCAEAARRSVAAHAWLADGALGLLLQLPVLLFALAQRTCATESGLGAV